MIFQQCSFVVYNVHELKYNPTHLIRIRDSKTNT